MKDTEASALQKMNPIKLNQISASSHRIRMAYDGQELSIGTAFFYKHREKYWLVTNWHNLTGLNPETQKPLSEKTCGIPNQIILKVAELVKKNGIDCLAWSESIIPLYDVEGNPKWKIHPQYGEKVDLGVLEFDTVREGIAFVNDESRLELSKIPLSAGIDAFVIGYPLGLTGGVSLPLWKRASIASEPSIDVDGLPKILIDTATREGMSGSPVYARYTGYWRSDDKTEEDDFVFGEGTRFLGIYSGRILRKDLFDAQIGIVWKESAIVDAIEGSQYGSVR